MARDSEAATAHRPGAASNASGASAAPHAKQEAMDEDVGEALSEHAPRETHPPSQALPNGAQGSAPKRSGSPQHAEPAQSQKRPRYDGALPDAHDTPQTGANPSSQGNSPSHMGSALQECTYPFRDPSAWGEQAPQLDVYIWDYLQCRGLTKAAQVLAEECKLPERPEVPLRTPMGLLFEYWTVFWDVFTSRSGRGSSGAAAYNEFLEHRRSQRVRSEQRSSMYNGEANGTAELGIGGTALLQGASTPAMLMADQDAAAATLLPNTLNIGTPGGGVEQSPHTPRMQMPRTPTPQQPMPPPGMQQPPAGQGAAQDAPQPGPQQAPQQQQQQQQHAPQAQAQPPQGAPLSTPQMQHATPQLGPQAQQGGLPLHLQQQQQTLARTQAAQGWNPAALSPQQQQNLLITAALRQGIQVEEIKNLPPATRLALINSIMPNAATLAASQNRRQGLAVDPQLQARVLQQQQMQNQAVAQTLKIQNSSQTPMPNPFDRPGVAARPGAPLMPSSPAGKLQQANGGGNDMQGLNRAPSMGGSGYFAGAQQQQQPQQQQQHPAQQQHAAQQQQPTPQQKQMLLVQYQTLQTAAKSEWMKAQSAPTPALAQQLLANARQFQARAQSTINALQGKMMPQQAFADAQLQTPNPMLLQQLQKGLGGQGQGQPGQPGQPMGMQPGLQQAQLLHLQSLVQKGLASPALLQQQLMAGIEHVNGDRPMQ